MNEELLDDPVALLAADRIGLLRALATAGAQVRELAALGEEAGLSRLAAGGVPRSLVLVAEPPA
ncbi:MAG: RpiR family transcriptional regulator, partial [Actinomycetota bacterium]|nr:RpiR family transcriptional regulator [Actinomycetota bacterium]